jgi:hypothetical protein
VSLDALLLATVDYLRSPSGLGLSSDQCDEQPDGQPPPVAGQVYYAVHEGEWTNNDDLALDEHFGLEITITLRSGVVPRDRTAIGILRDLRRRAAALRAKVHMAYGILDLAGGSYGGGVWTGGRGYSLAATDNGFVEPLVFLNAGRPSPRGPDWFGAEGAADPPTGVSRTLAFGRARRVQTIESQT